MTRSLDDWIWDMRQAIHHAAAPAGRFCLHGHDWALLGVPEHVPLDVTLARLDATEQAAWEAMVAAQEAWTAVLRAREVARREQARQGLRIIDGEREDRAA